MKTGKKLAKKLIAFQGAPGAYSDLACRAAMPSYKTLPMASFEEAFAAVTSGKTQLAMIPVENSIAGRVADVYHLLPKSGLYIIGEHYQPVVHHLLALPGTSLKDIKKVESHIQALTQCKMWLKKKGIQSIVTSDTAASAAAIAARKDKTVAAIASELAGEIYGLKSLAADIADLHNNTTRFLILSKEKKIWPKRAGGGTITSLVFRVRSVPAALYKALGGFATSGINLTKLESYLVDGNFTAAEFYVDAEGHPDDPGMKHALDELRFFAKDLRIVGVYKASPWRG
jgi:prephenate dehydratase